MVHEVAASALGWCRVCASAFLCAGVCMCTSAYAFLPEKPINKVSCKCLKVEGEKMTNISIAMIAM